MILVIWQVVCRVERMEVAEITKNLSVRFVLFTLQMSTSWLKRLSSMQIASAFLFLQIADKMQLSKLDE